MKKAFLILATGFTLVISACGSDRTAEDNTDSLMADSAVLDTATMSMDTTAIRADKLNTDSTIVIP